MSIALPPDILAYAESEIAAGRAQSVDQWIEEAARAHKLRMEALRESLDAAEREAAEKGALSLDETLARVDARLAAKA